MIEVTAFINPAGSIANPTWSGVKWYAPSKYIGITTKVSNKVIIDIITNITPKVYVGDLKTFKSSIGSSNFNCLIGKKISDIIPTINAIIALLFPSKLNPIIIPPKPKVDKIIDNISILGFVTSVTFSKYLYPTNIAIIIKGISIINR